MSFADKRGAPLSLLLYKYDSCGYCQDVMTRARELGLQLPTRDTRKEVGAREDLVRIGGKSQVPCLIVNGQAMYESADIIRFLENDVRALAG